MSTVGLYCNRWGMDGRVSCVKLVFHLVYNIDEINVSLIQNGYFDGRRFLKVYSV
jgi:hypothetical protein